MSELFVDEGKKTCKECLVERDIKEFKVNVNRKAGAPYRLAKCRVCEDVDLRKAKAAQFPTKYKNCYRCGIPYYFKRQRCPKCSHGEVVEDFSRPVEYREGHWQNFPTLLNPLTGQHEPTQQLISKLTDIDDFNMVMKKNRISPAASIRIYVELFNRY